MRKRRTVAIVFGLLVLVAGILAVRARQETQRRERERQVCMERVHALSEAIDAYWDAHRRPSGPQLTSAAFLLYLRKIEQIPRGGEEVFLCPADPDVRPPVTDEDRARYETVDLWEPRDYRTLMSYAHRYTRRYPFHPDEPLGEQWAICDRQGADGRTPHHRDGIVVGFADGSARFLDRTALGLAPDEPIVVGPDSTHPKLRMMYFAEERKD